MSGNYGSKRRRYSSLDVVRAIFLYCSSVNNQDVGPAIDLLP